MLLHAHNPVDWYPWGEEALAKARTERKLIFLSIGYSSCYWCHVMERESFLDDEVAAALNKNYVCIKVDREERPDIDHIYMTALGVMGRQGGWPLTMILTPDARPIIGGTYFPPRDKDLDLPANQAPPAAAKPRVTGLLTLLPLVTDSWAKNPQELEDYSAQIAAAVKRSLRQRVAVAALPAADLPAKTLAALAEQFDREYGGFSYSESNPRRPKFPEPSNLLFLLDRADRDEDESARRMLMVTLEHMARGGIQRSPWWRLPPLQHRSLLAHPTFRKDALRQCPTGHGLCGGGGAMRPSRFRPRGRGTAGIRESRAPVAGGRILLRARRRDRRRRRTILRLDARRVGVRAGRR